MKRRIIDLSTGKTVEFENKAEAVAKIKEIYANESELVFAELISSLILYDTVDNVLDIIKDCYEDIDTGILN